MTSQPGRGVHRAPAGRLDLQQLEGTGEQPPVLRGERTAGALPRPRPQHAQPLAVVLLEIRADVRVQRAYPALQLDGRPAEVEPAILGGDLVRVGDAIV